MSKAYQNSTQLSSNTISSEKRRLGGHRRSQVETLACRSIRRQFALSSAHAKLVAELQGYRG